jgi:transposase
MLLTSRKLLQRKLLDLELELRGTLRNFGLKVGIVSGSRYEARVREFVAGFPRLAAIAEPLLNVHRVMRQQLAVLHKMLLDTVRDDPVCRRLMTAPGVGAVVALTYRATLDQPQRFVHSRAVGAHVGLTPKRYQSGETGLVGTGLVRPGKAATAESGTQSPTSHTPARYRRQTPNHDHAHATRRSACRPPRASPLHKIVVRIAGGLIEIPKPFTTAAIAAQSAQ